jgi:cytochrome d ubiquinol oxidase subunit II
LTFFWRILAILYFFNSVTRKPSNPCPEIPARNAIPFLLVFLPLLFGSWSRRFAVDPRHKVSYESFKYFHNLIGMPPIAVLFLSGTLLVLFGIGRTLFGSVYTKGIWFTGTGTVLVVFSLFCLAGYHHTAYYPSTFDLQSSLTIENSSSSRYTLVSMSYVSLMVPFVIAYIFYAWRSLNREKITAGELKNESHKY